MRKVKRRALAGSPQLHGSGCGSFTTPRRFPLPLFPFPALLFLGCPREQKHARMQQPYWDGALLNCTDCGSLVNKSAADQSNQASIQSPGSAPPPPTPTITGKHQQSGEQQAAGALHRARPQPGSNHQEQQRACTQIHKGRYPLCLSSPRH